MLASGVRWSDYLSIRHCFSIRQPGSDCECADRLSARASASVPLRVVRILRASQFWVRWYAYIGVPVGGRFGGRQVQNVNCSLRAPASCTSGGLAGLEKMPGFVALRWDLFRAGLVVIDAADRWLRFTSILVSKCMRVALIGWGPFFFGLYSLVHFSVKSPRLGLIKRPAEHGQAFVQPSRTQLRVPKEYLVCKARVGQDYISLSLWLSAPGRFCRPTTNTKEPRFSCIGIPHSTSVQLLGQAI
ncbi:unnamed protein product [Protopolystoma xenopodis]|uniref:Uncharacterized protein n=1 Tax=Protopolystoma xenopodis TaxID=117903 RepID=A0A448WTG3_9PLAT|nr:unnamed protein product [Protopolystoma xenopodis]